MIPVMIMKTGEVGGITYLAGVEYPLDEKTAHQVMRTIPAFRNEDALDCATCGDHPEGGLVIREDV